MTTATTPATTGPTISTETGRPGAVVLGDDPVGVALRWVAAYGLDGSGTAPMTEPFDDESFALFLRRIEVGKLIGLAAIAVRNGDLPVTPSQRETVAGRHLSAMGQAIRLEGLLVELTDRLSAADIEVRVLKGSAVAQLDYEDPCLRPFVDVDLLVRSDDFARAVTVLEDAGIGRIWGAPRAGFDRRFGKGATLRTAAGFEVDLHRTFVQGPWGLTVELADLWEDSRPIEIGGRTLPALTDGARLLHAAIHATLGHQLTVPYLPSRDLAEMLLFGEAAAADDARRLAQRWQMEAVLAEAVTLAWTVLELADVTALSAWAEAYQPSELDARRRAVYRADGASYTAKSLAALTALPRLRDRVALVTTLAFPSRAFLDDHGLTYRTWLGRGVSKAVRARRRG